MSPTPPPELTALTLERAQALVGLCDQVLLVWARHLAASCQQSEVAVADMLAAFAQLGAHGQPVPAPGQTSSPEATEVAPLVADPVERMYKGLQYQDRITQMMTLLHDDMVRFHHAVHCGQTDLDATAWLNRLQAQYVMEEQHHPGGPQAGDGTDDQTTFF